MSGTPAAGPEPHEPLDEPRHEPADEPAGGPRRRRLPVLLAVLAAILVIALSVTVPILVQDGRDEPVGAAVNLDRVRVYEGLRNDHTEKDVDYDTTPPVGGPHDPVWLDCGAYDAPVRDENAVHDLEHGAVWITYDPGLDPDDVELLAQALPQNGILSPYDGLPAPVVVTVWARQLDLTGADDPRLPLFIAGFGDGHTAPEPFASCAGGATSGDGGRTTEV